MTMKLKGLILILLVCFLSLDSTKLIGQTNQEKKIHLAMFTTRAEGDPFWGIFVLFMQEAAQDLKIRLDVYYANSNVIRLRKQIKEAISNQVDALIFPNFKKGGASFLKIAEESETPAFLVNQGISEEFVGLPRERYKYWIGEFLPDEEDAGYQLAKLLIKAADQAGKMDSRGLIQVIGIEGILSDTASVKRVQGLRRAVEENPKKIILRQVVPANWVARDAEVSHSILKYRYPELTVAWAASDHMAKGIQRAAKKLNQIAGKDFFTGGIDWSIDGIQGVKEGWMTATLGGHFMEGAWVVVMLYDYLNKKDFEDTGLRHRLPMFPITNNNVDFFQKHFRPEDWSKIDFTKFSRVLNPQQKTYNFGLKSVLQQLRNN
ncbi:MAG: substrate-binding domain-containing protein [Proteobacteria bacterium]|nr:substrate-binding domain-containing protein [Pseudomonadota bacterium]